MKEDRQLCYQYAIKLGVVTQVLTLGDRGRKISSRSCQGQEFSYVLSSWSVGGWGGVGGGGIWGGTTWAHWESVGFVNKLKTWLSSTFFLSSGPVYRQSELHVTQKVNGIFPWNCLDQGCYVWPCFCYCLWADLKPLLIIIMTFSLHSVPVSPLVSLTNCIF